MYNLHQEPTKCTYIFLLHFHLQFSTGNPAVVRVTSLLQEHNVIKCVKLLHYIEFSMIIC